LDTTSQVRAARLGSLSMLASAVAGVIGIAFILLMYGAFAAGANGAGMTFGRINDVAVLVQFLLAVPGVIAIGAALRSSHPHMSLFGTPLAVAALALIVVFQGLLVAGLLTFEQEIGVASLGLLGFGAWMIATAVAGRRSGAGPTGPGTAILAAFYLGYPLWAWRVGRWMDTAPVARTAKMRAVARTR